MEKIDKRKIFLIIIIVLILLVIALFVGKFTFSYLGPNISDDASNKGEITASGDTIIFNNGKALTLSATTDNFKTGGTNLTSTTNPTAKLVASSKTNKADATYYVGVYIKNNTYTYSTTAKTPEVLLTIKDEKGSNVTSVDGLTYTTSGGVSGFDVTEKSGLFNVKTDYPITTTSSTTGTTHTWTFTLTFINLSTDQSVNENATMNIDVVLQQEMYHIPRFDEICDETTLACHVAKLYTGTQGKNNIYYHNGTIKSDSEFRIVTTTYPAGTVLDANDGSYRYAGASESVNNFVCFGSNESPCPTDNLYRIIGVFGDQVKLIKYDYANSNLLGTDGDYNSWSTYSKSAYPTYKGELTTINRYYWNYKNDTNINNQMGSNEWSTSLFNKTNLNINYLNKFDATWKNMIEDTTWKVSGHTSVDATPSLMYTAEITKASKTYGPSDGVSKIGLMYASDYGFAADPSAWTTTLYNYSSSSITSVNWMYMGLYEWPMTPYSSGSIDVLDLNSSGTLEIHAAVDSYGARPVLYLKSSVLYAGGTGTKDSPITIVV